jgi:hypothetical protein
MFSRMFRGIAVFSVVLSLGALTVSPAQAAPRTASRPAASSLASGLSLRGILAAVQSLVLPGKEYYGGQNPGNNPPGREGTGICPLGNPGNNHPGKG